MFLIYRLASEGKFLQFVLSESVLSKAEDLSLLPYGSQVFSALLGVLDLSLQVFDHFTVASLEQDHLVGDNSHFEEGECLSLRPWETLDNVVGLL